MPSLHMRPVLFSLLDHKKGVIRFIPSPFASLPAPTSFTYIPSYCCRVMHLLSPLQMPGFSTYKAEMCGAFLRRLFLVSREIFWQEINTITYQTRCTSVRMMSGETRGQKK